MVRPLVVLLLCVWLLAMALPSPSADNGLAPLDPRVQASFVADTQVGIVLAGPPCTCVLFPTGCIAGQCGSGQVCTPVGIDPQIMCPGIGKTNNTCACM